ncbi:hypothetical protein Droror1_Dr00014378 [Drosera rotundifolia]
MDESMDECTCSKLNSCFDPRNLKLPISSISLLANPIWLRWEWVKDWMLRMRMKLGGWFRGLNREEPAGLGGPNAERFVIDSRGALVEEKLWCKVVARGSV